jgi:hypothetical protein
MGPRAKRTAVVTTTIGALAIVVAMAGPSGAGLKTKSASTAIEVDDQSAASAQCKRGSEAVSGGFDVTPFDVNYDDGTIWPIDSRRRGKRKWTSSGHNYALSGNGELTSFAYCDKSEPGLKVKSASVELPGSGPPPSAASVTAKCKKGSEAVSGGGGGDVTVFSELGQAVVLIESRREGRRKWTVTGSNYGNNAGELTAFVYCDKSEPALRTKQKAVTLGAYPNTATETAKCKRGSQAVSGGFGSPDFDPDVTGAVIIALTSMRAGGHRWTATGYNDHLTGGRFVVYAYCEKK